MTQFKEVLNLAYAVRASFEEIARNIGNKSLMGYCARASTQLHRVADLLQLKNVYIVCNWGHVFNYYRGHLIDITASQYPVYANQRVLIVKVPFDEICNHPIYSKTHTPVGNKYKTLKELEEKTAWKLYTADNKVVNGYVGIQGE